MKCLTPVPVNRVLNGVKMYSEHACGKCVLCRVTRQQIWALRILLESLRHDNSVFITLTYEDSKLPETKDNARKDFQKFMKRLRKSLNQEKIRFFACYELGKKKNRPHFHVVIFGLSVDWCFNNSLTWKNDESNIKFLWGNGMTKTDPLTPGRAAYVAKYCLKEQEEDETFTLQSRRPGIAGSGENVKDIIPLIADALENKKIEIINDRGISTGIVSGIRFMGKIYPIGYYLRQKLIEQLGSEKDNFQQSLKNHREVIKKMLMSYDDKVKEREIAEQAYRAQKRKLGRKIEI